MYNFSVGLQLYTVRDEVEKDFEGTLKKVKEFGYEGVEFAGLFDHSAEEVKKMCENAGVVPISAHVNYHEMLAGEETFKKYAEIGCKYIVIPWIETEYHAGGEKNAEFIASIKTFAEHAHKYGMKLCYHNHDFEFEKVNGEYKLDLLYKALPKEVLLTEIDTCWAKVGGTDPAAYVRKYADRTEIIHLKDFAGHKSENMYGLIGVDEDTEKEASGEFELRAVGSGLQNIPSILDAAEEVGAGWVIVEQDFPTKGKTPMECAKESMDYLKSVMK